MRQSAARQHRPAEPGIAAPAPGDMVDPLHPMHRDLLARWADADLPIEQKFAPVVRLAIVLTAAAACWLAVIAAAWTTRALF